MKHLEVLLYMAYLSQGFPEKRFQSKTTRRFKPEATNLKFDVLEIGSRQSYQCWVEYLSDLYIHVITSFSFLFLLFFLFLLITPLFFGLFISVTFATYRLLGRLLFWRGLCVFIVFLSGEERKGKNCKK